MSLSLLTLVTTVQPMAEDTAPPPSTSAGMLFACWSIVIVLAAMFFVFMRAHKREYAVAVLPLVITPLMHICSGVLARWLDGILPLTWVELRVALDLIAAPDLLPADRFQLSLHSRAAFPQCVPDFLLRLHHHFGSGPNHQRIVHVQVVGYLLS